MKRLILTVVLVVVLAMSVFGGVAAAHGPPDFDKATDICTKTGDKPAWCPAHHSF